MKRFLILPVLCLSACGGNADSPEVSRAHMPEAQGMTYRQFREHTGGGEAAQKRFLMLDRDNNGRIAPHEMGGP